MKFNTVISNPPYNKGMDLDFIKLGHELSDEHTVMIVPAKWQTTADDYRGCASKTIDYKQFREQLVPHMSKVVFYPDCLDIFEIALNDGITYFIMDKDVHETCEVVNRCVRQPYFNSTATRSILNKETLHNIGQEIVEYLGDYKKYEWERKKVEKNYYVSTTSMFSNSLGQSGSYDWDAGGIREGSAGEGGLLLTKAGNVQVLSKSDICYGLVPVQGSKVVTFQSDEKSECESFISWAYSNLQGSSC